ncbi:MAG: hypothetical protein DSM106950_42110 [Stigonema ocellatum SAG 48.90 = DSM 106950]|nr:hypothetical protein [Stigonema ocellatum SAG 48.90 = DSM 106950]
MAKKQRTFISVEIDPDKKDEFVKRLKLDNRTATEVILGFVDEYLSSKQQEAIDLMEIRRRLEVVEQRIGIENSCLVGESTA